MLMWFAENSMTILVSAVLVAVVLAVIVSMIKNKKSGGSCSCGCAGCANAPYCHKKP